MQSFSPLIRMLRNALLPKGTEPVSLLKLNVATAFNTPFMEKIYKELDDAIKMQKIGLDELTPCQKLALNVLMDSGDFEIETVEKSVNNFVEFEKRKSLN